MVAPVATGSPLPPWSVVVCCIEMRHSNRIMKELQRSYKGSINELQKEFSMIHKGITEIMNEL